MSKNGPDGDSGYKILKMSHFGCIHLYICWIPQLGMAIHTAKVHRQNLRRLRGYSCRAAAHPRHRTSKPSRATGPLGLTPCVECAPETDRAVSRSRAHFCLLDYLKAPSTSPPPGWQQPAPWLTEAGEPESETLAVHRRQDRRAG
jgi:hypothetical protein